MAEAHRSAIAYRIEVRGRLPVGAAEELSDFTVEVGPRTTALSGPVPDASALYGLIGRLEALGLALVSVVPRDPTIPTTDRS
jgi:hypothetical protein